LDDKAMELLASIGFDPQFGARPLKRAIQHYIVDKLALLILEGKFVSGDKIRISSMNGEFVFSKS